MSAPVAERASPKEILRQRARALAAIPATSAPVAEGCVVVEFALAEERYALEMRHVAEIAPLDQLTPLPCTPAFVAGVINVRGRIVAVVDLKTFFDLPDRGICDLHRVIILQHDDIEFGVLADHVVGTRAISVAALQPALPTLTGIRAEYLKGLTPERIIVLDAARILSDPKLLVDEAPRPEPPRQQSL